MKRILLSVAMIALLPGFWKAATVHAASGIKQPVSTLLQKNANDPANYVGSDTCMTCHADVAKSFATNPHSRLALTHGGKGATCETCHGPGKAHVDSGGDATKIFNFRKASAKQVDATCLGCHAGVHPNFGGTPHAKAGLSCISCHSNHASQTEATLLKAPQPQLCENCHADIKMAFAQPFHHPVEEGVLKCTDCHDPHGTSQGNQLRSTADQNAICTKCHTEVAGPFVYEHPPVKVEGCTTCHSPHGSPNPRFLKVSNVNMLCLQCHSASMNFTAPGTPSFHNQAAQYQACTICHTQIHGSNASSTFFK
ncbi:MAG: DmsE family decaheme c-type cytochrome [Acidobacteriaceae bacterium]